MEVLKSALFLIQDIGVIDRDDLRLDTACLGQQIGIS